MSKKKTVSKQVPTTYRVPSDIRDELEEAAGEQDSNPSVLVRQILRDWWRKRKERKPEPEAQE